MTAFSPAAGAGENAGWRLCVAAAVAVGGGGWVLAGVFDSWWARGLGLLAPAVGALVGLYASRSRWSYLPVPAALVAGWVAMLPDAGGPRLITEALNSGGLSQPPVPFDPGWRFLLVALLVAAAAVSVLLGQARLAVLPGAAVVLVGVLVQPTDGAVVAVIGGLVFLAAALAVAVGGEDAGSGGFELRRLARGGAALGGLVALLVALSQFGFLFPSSEAHEVIPPKRPEVPPPTPDRVLFKVEADRPLPLRLGVLDVYDGRGFLTPPYDTRRFRKLDAPTAAADGGAFAAIEIVDLGGHLLPGLASPAGVRVRGARVEVDPRTDQLRLPKTRARKGLKYQIVGAPVPSAADLEASPPAGDGLREFLDVPAPPPAVEALLAEAPTSSYARLQFLRTALYSRVVAAGAGNPVDVPPERVAELLDGKEGSPYEIAAAEVLLARWGGVPARLGYGYYDPQGSGEIRPRNGAMWMEAYFEGHGWVPVVGSPPRAKSSFNREPKKQDPLVRATDDLALVVYVPVRLTTVRLLYTYVRWWVARVLPGLVAVGLAVALVPFALRQLRRWRRRRWADTPARKLLVAYAELRDGALDMNIGAPEMTPLEFLAAVAPDDEHTQLAWLVTRGLWGDLRRDLTAADVQAGEDMAASVLRRMRRAQPFANRVGALISRASLRSPWSTDIPSVRGFGLHRLRLAPAALLLVVPLAFSTAPAAVEKADVPRSVVGVEVREEPTAAEAFDQAGAASIVEHGQVFSLRRGDDVEGSLQIGAFEPGLTASDGDVRRAVVKSIGGGQFRLIRIGSVRAYALDLPEQRFLLWFPPDGRSYYLVVTRSSFDQADRFLAALVEYQRTGRLPGAAEQPAPATDVPVPDPRRGAPQ